MDGNDDDHAILLHYNTMALTSTVFLGYDLLQQKKIAILALCQRFDVLSAADHLTTEVLVLFHDILKASGHDWRGSLKGKTPNIERGRDAANQQLVADYFFRVKVELSPLK